VEGEAKKLFIDEGKCGLAFEPENHIDLAEKLLILFQNKSLLTNLGNNAFTYVCSKFDRNKIAKSFYEKLQGLKKKDLN
jgi:glycosyltransferase involved in cell wall biosynthesis